MHTSYSLRIPKVEPQKEVLAKVFLNDHNYSSCLD